ncbi:type 1 glutamine amidotransferase domain-containing protein [Dermacoccus sp. 147Ba]|uniref:type 1 glutamine amidotransferase domain-containing protein n=1 Tax=Dermacoccus sp. 147Ba TaxID=2510111 RepID=UPI00101BDDCF|nr:type 1 glutamine amidotransferase domain-containing protein [Dermacoccus sp. 147Ba]RYI21408.1 type 1 glutamine amidotransferase domain-containing protein [Dermacoccus sp. 147Ba]
MSKILFVVSAATNWTLADGTQHPTGFWAEELLAPYRLFTEAGDTVEFATPGGVAPVADEASLAPEMNDGNDVRPELDAIDALKQPLNLSDVALDDYDAVFYPGGHGPMEDLAVDATSGKLIADTLVAGKPVAIVCHGPAALLPARDENGDPVVKGRKLTAFSNEEERAGGNADNAKWLLEDRLREDGAELSVGEAWQPNVVVDGDLLTGQNPASSKPLAEELKKRLG